MEIDKWLGLYKIKSFPWIDSKRIYFNLQYYEPGQSISKPPIWDKTVFIVDNIAGKRLVSNYLNTLVEFVAGLCIGKDEEITIEGEIL